MSLSDKILMMKLEPTWQGIPIEIKEDVVKNLDYKSRFRLRVCSKSDQNLVDNCPIVLEQVEMYALPYENIKSYPEVLYIKDQFGTFEIRENIVAHFFEIFKHKESTTKSVIFGFKTPTMDATELANQLLTKICSIQMTKRQVPFKIKSRSINFQLREFSAMDSLRMFQIFDPKYLKSILFHRMSTRDLIDMLVTTEGWRNAKEIYFYGCNGIPIDTVLHPDKIRVSTDTLSADNAWKIIKVFLTRKTWEPGFGFRIAYSNSLTDEQVISKSEIVPRKVTLPRERPEFPQEYSYHFPVKHFILVMRFFTFDVGSHVMEGYICSVENPDEDFNIFRAWNPPDQWQLLRRLNDFKPRTN